MGGEWRCLKCLSRTFGLVCHCGERRDDTIPTDAIAAIASNGMLHKEVCDARYRLDPPLRHAAAFDPRAASRSQSRSRGKGGGKRGQRKGQRLDSPPHGKRAPSRGKSPSRGKARGKASKPAKRPPPACPDIAVEVKTPKPRPPQ